MAFTTKLQGALTRGFAKAKGFARKTGENANQLASKGANKLEKAQLRVQADELTTKLGVEVYRRLVELGQPTLDRDNPAIRELLDAVKGLKTQIAIKDSEYKEIGVLGAAKA